ncbi:hypothetical protein [Govanella unica]|uniref:Uncharacterized protein n=1 Tax=Govanella unica TaxID=2975056 RepID=A0A9X3Z6B0_9PROT|nr:hypothetical protein [Govania unica]MDA5192739.1 hypothetical protein [Govania unica]
MIKKFEAAIYNQNVRDCLSVGDRHRDLDDEWAEIHYIEIRAHTQEEARQQITRKYPASKGFVIREVEEVREFY